MDIAISDGGDSGGMFVQQFALHHARKVVPKTVPVRKAWNDTGYEDRRPDSVSFSLYDVEDQTTAVSTITLTDENVSATESNVWEGEFEDVPDTRGDGTFIRYLVKEADVQGYTEAYRRNVSGLKISYNRMPANGVYV